MSSHLIDRTAQSGRVLIVGCGFVGRVLARGLVARGQVVLGTARSEAGLDAVRACAATALPLDLAAGPPDWAALLAHARPEVCHCLLPPGPAARESLLPAVASLSQALGDACGVLASSTAVYGDQAGGTVTAETAVEAEDERAGALLAIEQAWLAGPGRRHVVRFAGLYGPGRVIGLRDLRAGRPVGGDPGRWLNLIHCEDAAALLGCVAATPGAAAVELGADGSPVPRRAYYDAVAATWGLPPPRYEPALAPLRGGGSRRCDPATTRARTGWSPRHADCIAGLAAIRAGEGDVPG